MNIPEGIPSGRNPKQILNSKRLKFSNLGLIYCFEFRIYDFGFSHPMDE